MSSIFSFPLDKVTSESEFNDFLANATISDKEICNMPLNSFAVSEREKGGVKLSYLQGHYVRSLLTFVFGGKWSYEITETKSVCHEFVKNGKTGHTAYTTSYTKLKVDWQDGSTSSYHDVGHGNGISYLDEISAIELSEKEAVTDSLKRCAVNLGDPFGLVLYTEFKTPARYKAVSPADINVQVNELRTRSTIGVPLGRFVLKVLGRNKFEDVQEPHELIVAHEIFAFGERVLNILNLSKTKHGQENTKP